MILTGTPAWWRRQRERVGDEVVTEIDGIGASSTPSSATQRSAVNSPLREAMQCRFSTSSTAKSRRRPRPFERSTRHAGDVLAEVAAAAQTK